jgi:hypothetical protein
MLARNFAFSKKLFQLQKSEQIARADRTNDASADAPPTAAVVAGVPGC